MLERPCIEPPQVLFASAQASVRFALSCLEPAGSFLRARSSFVDPDGNVMHWHDFGDLEGPGWAANAVGGAHLLYRWGAFTGEAENQRQAELLVDHVLEDGFLRSDGFVWPYWNLARECFCLNYAHNDDWLCPGSLAKIGVQMLDLAADLGEGPRAARLQAAAQELGAWLSVHVPRLDSGWVPRRITSDGAPYALTPEGAPDPIFDHSADGLFLLELWTRLGERERALALGEAFVTAGGLWGSINHDTYDDHENVAYAVAFRVLRRAADLLGRPEWRDFAYAVALPAMAHFRMHSDLHGVATRGLYWMEESWDTAYLWENAEVAQAHLEAWLERGDSACGDMAIETLSTIAHHHYGPLGFLTEGVDWNNHVTQRHHTDRAYYGAIRFTEPLLNNLHLVGPTLTYLESAGFHPAAGDRSAAGVQALRDLSAGDRVAAGALERPGARYLLRLPYPLLASDQSVEEVLAFVRQAGIDGVLLFESDFDTDPALLTLDALEERFARLGELVPRFRQAGLEVHLNVMITLGHVDAGGGHPQRFGFQFLVNEEGQTSRSSACPLDPVWLDYVAQIYRWAAQCGADAVWVDDDVRFLLHDLEGMTCFCPLHLAEMAARLGRAAPLTRQELAEALRDDRGDAAVRSAWFALEEEAMLTLARRVEREVRAVEPHQRIGLMSVGATIHSAEGRHTDRLLRALAGPESAPMLRPGSGFWHDAEPGAVLIKTEDVARQAAFLGRDVRLVAEIENHPYSPFQKSLRIFGLEMALDVLAGMAELSLNILPSTGPLRLDDVDYGEYLRQTRPFLDALAGACTGKVRIGIGVEASEEFARRMRLQGRPLASWVERRPWETVLGRLGLPIGGPYCAPHLIAGDAAAAMDRYGLGSAFQDGAVLTPGAVCELLAQGWGDRLGIREVRAAAAGVNEHFTEDALNEPHTGAILPVRHYAGLLGPHSFVLEERAHARVLSRWVDVDSQDQGTATVALELADGARLGLLPFEIGRPAHQLLVPARREQWAALFEWVGRGPLPCRLLGGVNLYPQLLVGPEREELLLAIANLSADERIARVAVAGWAQPEQVWRLAPSGEWVREDAGLQIAVPGWTVGVWRWKLR